LSIKDINLNSPVKIIEKVIVVDEKKSEKDDIG